MGIGAVLSAIGSFIGGLAKSLVLPLMAWLAGKRKAENRQKEEVLEDGVKAKAVRDELDALDAAALRARAAKWVRRDPKSDK